LKELSNLSPRVKRLRQTLFETKPKFSTERLRVLREVYAKTEGEPAAIRRAKVLSSLLREMTLYLDPDNLNLIVGNQTGSRVGMHPYPEYSAKWMGREGQFDTALGKADVSEDDVRLLKETSAYWGDRCILSRTKAIWREKRAGFPDRDKIVRAGIWNDAIAVPLGRVSVDYGKVVAKGLLSVIDEARTRLQQLEIGNAESLSQRSFLKAVIISCEGVIALGGRYADLARSLASKEQDPAKRKELEKVAEVCTRVPAYPARTFHEALQSFWFVHVAVLIEHCSDGITPGRFSQYIYPFLEKDLQNGSITEAEALELLQMVFIKLNETTKHWPGKGFEQDMGTMAHNVNLGGLTPSGRDATNELDYMLLDTQLSLQLPQPTLSLQYHDKISERLLQKSMELVSTGVGMPAFFNADLNVQRLLTQGATLEDARNQAIIGCVECGFSHTAASMWGGSMNIPKLLEMALHDGVDPVTKMPLGAKTGGIEQFDSYEKLCAAIQKQIQWFLPAFFDFDNTGETLNGEIAPVPFTSALIDDCIKRGKDIFQGGARYTMNGVAPVGVVDLGDSLAAIKKLVYEEKRYTLAQVVEALDADFIGHESLREALLDVPKFGNDDEYPDGIVAEWYDYFYSEHQKNRDYLNGQVRPPALSITNHYALGRHVGATPNGRKAKATLADGSVSASPGMDKNGPTSLIKSATKVLDTTKYACGQLNMKFHPSSLETREGRRKLMALTKSYLDMGGHHIQFNVLKAETLRDAQKHPENYRDLVVRVAGFSTFFIHMDRTVQDEIIGRTEIAI